MALWSFEFPKLWFLALPTLIFSYLLYPSCRCKDNLHHHNGRTTLRWPNRRPKAVLDEGVTSKRLPSSGLLFGASPCCAPGWDFVSTIDYPKEFAGLLQHSRACWEILCRRRTPHCHWKHPDMPGAVDTRNWVGNTLVSKGPLHWHLSSTDTLRSILLNTLEYLPHKYLESVQDFSLLLL